MLRLTDKELKRLINIVSQVSVPVAKSPEFVDLINKMSKMVDEFVIVRKGRK